MTEISARARAEKFATGRALNDMRLFSTCYSSRVRWEVGRVENAFFELKGRCSTTELRPYGVNFLL